MEAITNIDTIKIQIDRDDPLDQFQVLNGLVEVIGKLESIFIRFIDKPIGMGRIYREHFVFYKGKKIAGITTGSCSVGSIRTNDLRRVWFIAIEYDGLFRFHDMDRGSLACLLEVCIYLNTRAIPLRITALDICLDLIGAKPSEVLVLVIERLKRIKYHWVTGCPTYENTTYVEIQSFNMLSQAYSYPKQIKDKWIKEDIVRFECKFYQSFFRKHENSIKAIARTINNYAVLYIENPIVRSSIITQYNKQSIDLTAKPIERYRLNIDMDYVEEFISMLMTIDEVFTYDLVAPARDRVKPTNETFFKASI
ncbi:hypothetical protein [Sulfurimonas sp.]|uniref:hypothetical protein n=1 Tax=Sulfurimonas sp. TaxID=2022749 RepID=UPI002607CF53|nr:hypothetical protein [Sulfurimonas sp.]MCW8895001.1 hypothetical protein [Sulfurimonas sp.]